MRRRRPFLAPQAPGIGAEDLGRLWLAPHTLRKNNVRRLLALITGYAARRAADADRGRAGRALGSRSFPRRDAGQSYPSRGVNGAVLAEQMTVGGPTQDSERATDILAPSLPARHRWPCCCTGAGLGGSPYSRQGRRATQALTCEVANGAAGGKE
jgi:hypothetical protein